jgi:hypothetical protein
MADLVARLDVAIDAQGKLKLDSGSSTNGPLLVSKGGTGQSTAPDQKYLVGNSSGFDLFTPHGFIYSGPTSTGSGSTVAHSGTVVLASPQTLDGLNIYTDFTLNAGVTLTLGANTDRLIIYASSSITINGTIAANGKGSAAGQVGFTQPGGGGGGGATGTAPTAGGAVQMHGVTRTNGGIAGVNGASGGSAGTLQTGNNFSFADPFSILGGAGGGQGGNNTGSAGGAGGASIVLIAPVIILGAAAVLNTSGSSGSGGGNQGGGGGGGGAGNIYIYCRLFTDNGATYTMNAGSGGAAGPSGGFAGGAGRAGVKQIMQYANN